MSVQLCQELPYAAVFIPVKLAVAVLVEVADILAFPDVLRSAEGLSPVDLAVSIPIAFGQDFLAQFLRDLRRKNPFRLLS